MAKDDLEFERLHEALEARLSQMGRIYQRGQGEILVNHDYHGNRQIGVILLKQLPELELVRAARECLAKVSAGWEVWISADRSVGEQHCKVVTLKSIRHVPVAP